MIFLGFALNPDIDEAPSVQWKAGAMKFTDENWKAICEADKANSWGLLFDAVRIFEEYIALNNIYVDRKLIPAYLIDPDALEPHQLDAITSLTYNMGHPDIGYSRLIRHINENKIDSLRLLCPMEKC